MTETECILLVDDDSSITFAVSMGLQRPGRTIVTCSDLDAAEIALAWFPVTHVVSDVQLSGPFTFEGLHFVDRLRQVARDCRIVLITGYASDDLRRMALSHGAVAVVAKPFEIQELEDALASTLPPLSASADGDAPEPIVIPPLDEILRSDVLAIAFQPILRLQPDGGTEVFAHEALTRVLGSWAPGGPAFLFEYARRRARLPELNILTMEQAIQAARGLPESTLFVNVDPITFDRPDVVRSVLDAAARAAHRPERLVLELTERSGFTDADTAVRAFAELREAGVRFALDDHGSAYSHLGLIEKIQPHFIKISNDFGTDFELDTTKQRIVQNTLRLARDFGCETILEGVETATTAAAATTLGIELVQGYYYGRPQLLA